MVHVYGQRQNCNIKITYYANNKKINTFELIDYRFFKGMFKSTILSKYLCVYKKDECKSKRHIKNIKIGDLTHKPFLLKTYTIELYDNISSYRLMFYTENNFIIYKKKGKQS